MLWENPNVKLIPAERHDIILGLLINKRLTSPCNLLRRKPVLVSIQAATRDLLATQN